MNAWVESVDARRLGGTAAPRHRGSAARRLDGSAVRRRSLLHQLPPSRPTALPPATSSRPLPDVVEPRREELPVRVAQTIAIQLVRALRDDRQLWLGLFRLDRPVIGDLLLATSHIVIHSESVLPAGGTAKIRLRVGMAHQATPDHRGALRNRFVAGQTLNHCTTFRARQPSAV